MSGSSKPDDKRIRGLTLNSRASLKAKMNYPANNRIFGGGRGGKII